MPRNKAARSSRIADPARLQDHTGFADALAETIIGEFVAPIEERLTIVENSLPGAAVQIGDMQQADVQLAAGTQGGTVYVEPDGGFDESTIDRPVIVQQAPRGDSDEGGIVLFTAEVLDVKRMRLRWFAPFGAPGSTRVVYLIG